MVFSEFNIKSFATDSISVFAKEQLEKYLLDAGLECNPRGIQIELLQSRTLKNEGFCISIKEDSITISGNKNGILYGVYEFLEKYLGFCFAAYDAIIPDKKEYDLQACEYVKDGADLGYRTAAVQFGVWAGEADRALTLPYIDWLAKNRYNRILTWVSVYEQLKEQGMIPELEKRGIKLTVGHHQACYTFLPPYGNKYFDKKYYETNPEFYKLLQNGERYTPGDFGGQLVLCCHNNECIETFSNNVIKWLGDNSQVDCIALWPNDFTEEYCNCDECQKYTKTENYLYFENEVVKRIRAVMPHIKVDVLIYTDIWKKPESVVKLDDGIRIDQAAWCKNGLRCCGDKQGKSFIGTEYENNLLEYRSVCKDTVLYDYYMGNYNARQRIMPAADEMQSIFRRFVEKGISGSGTQMECFNLWNNLFNFYCFARTQYDTDLGFEDNLQRFCRLFGAAGEDISEIYRIFEDTVDGSVSIRYTGIYLIEHVDKDLIYSLFDSALSKAENKLLRNNVRMLRMAFRYSHLITEDKTTDESKEPNTVTYIDSTGELAYMSYAFDGYHNKQNVRGIAIPVTNKSDKKPDDKWYNFE